jgi:hypothetical protein
MIVKKEEDKNNEGVYSFWEQLKKLDENDNIIIDEIKIEETTIKILRENAAMIEKDIMDLETSLSRIYQKIEMIEFDDMEDVFDE